MPTGLQIPIGVSPTGSSALSTSDDNDKKIIGIALGADENENAFQQAIGMGEAAIFDVDDPTSRARVIQRLKQIFRRFESEKRYRLDLASIRWTSEEDTGNSVLSFRYINLESDEPQDFSRTFTTNSSPG